MKTQPFVKESKYKFYGCIINEEGLGFCNLEQDLFIIRGKLHICQFSPRARLLAARKGDTLPLPHLMPNANILFFFTSCCQQRDVMRAQEIGDDKSLTDQEFLLSEFKSANCIVQFE